MYRSFANRIVLLGTYAFIWVISNSNIHKTCHGKNVFNIVFDFFAPKKITIQLYTSLLSPPHY